LGDFKVPKSTPNNVVMFDKVMGTDKIGQYLEERLTPQQIVTLYTPELMRFKQEREHYLIPQYDGPVNSEINSEVPISKR